MMQTTRKHGNPRLARIGRDAMIAGATVFFLPLVLPRADGLADAHELVTLAVHHLWWQFAGATIFSLGTTVRLIGIQGHPGLPWPPFMRRLPHDVVASIQLRRRAWENRAKALAGEITAVPHARWKFRVAARRAARRRGVPLPRCLAERQTAGAAG